MYAETYGSILLEIPPGSGPPFSFPRACRRRTGSRCDCSGGIGGCATDERDAGAQKSIEIPAADSDAPTRRGTRQLVLPFDSILIAKECGRRTVVFHHPCRPAPQLRCAP